MNFLQEFTDVQNLLDNLFLLILMGKNAVKQSKGFVDFPKCGL